MQGSTRLTHMPGFAGSMRHLLIYMENITLPLTSNAKKIVQSIKNLGIKIKTTKILKRYAIQAWLYSQHTGIEDSLSYRARSCPKKKKEM